MLILALNDEAFVTLKGVSNGPATGFDQNRVFIGLSRKLNEYTTVEAGYLNHDVNTTDSLPNRMNHAFLVEVAFKVR